jgi:hypothetical protein
LGPTHLPRALPSLDGRVEPEAVLALTGEQMRAAGLSANKTASLRDLAGKVLDDTVVLDPHRLAREPDDEVVTRLSAVRGIGEWTAHMFLLFQLRRMRAESARRPAGARLQINPICAPRLISAAGLVAVQIRYLASRSACRLGAS